MCFCVFLRACVCLCLSCESLFVCVIVSVRVFQYVLSCVLVKKCVFGCKSAFVPLCVCPCLCICVCVCVCVYM